MLCRTVLFTPNANARFLTHCSFFLDDLNTTQTQHNDRQPNTNTGFLAGEFVEGSNFLWNADIKGPAITHLEQVPNVFWILLTIGIGASESERLNTGWVDPKDVKYSQPGLLRADYTPGDIGFDPFGLRPENPEDLKDMQTKELQNGRLAMIAAAGCMAQELANGKGILETLGVDAHL